MPDAERRKLTDSIASERKVSLATFFHEHLDVLIARNLSNRSIGRLAMAGTNLDPHDLARFVSAEAEDYDQALAEIMAARKTSHWMWYIFPQIDGLGFSSMSQKYAIKSLDEARRYLDHPVLGPRLVEIAEAALGVEGRSGHDIFGSPDDMKLKSSATLFASVAPPDSVFARLLDKFFDGKSDGKTLGLIEAMSGA